MRGAGVMSRDDGLPPWVLRLLLCLATSLAISGTAYVCAWLQYGNYVGYRWSQHFTRQTLNSVGKEIDEFQKQRGKVPADLGDLEMTKAERIRAGDPEWPKDAWDRPLHYNIENDGFSLFSLGADNLPGGRGLDADLIYGKENRAMERPTFWQFATALDTGGMLLACLLAGIVAFPICLVASGKWNESRYSFLGTIVSIAITVLFATGTAVFISAFHLPSGH
jgi:Type II secretion system (T2SS), protein G